MLNKKIIRQFLSYFIVGTICTFTSVILLYVFTEFFKLFYIISNIISFIIVLFLNYYLTKKFVFQDNINISKRLELIIYLIINIFAITLDSILVFIFTNVIGIYYIFSKLLTALIVFLWNFFARKLLYIKICK